MVHETKRMRRLTKRVLQKGKRRVPLPKRTMRLTKRALRLTKRAFHLRKRTPRGLSFSDAKAFTLARTPFGRPKRKKKTRGGRICAGEDE